VDGPLRSERVTAWMDSMHAALVANGVTRSAGHSLAAPTAVKSWIAQRRAYLVDQLDGLVAPFAVTTPARSPFTAVRPQVTLSGTAPVEVHSITVNGIPARLTWVGLHQWTLETTLRSGTHVVRIEGLDLRGEALPETVIELVATYLGPDPDAETPLRINEWMASNGSIPHPVDGQFHDWFELHNPGDDAVDLTDFFLSDNSSDPLMFRIPPGVVIPAHGHLLVWASGDDAQPGWVDGHLQASFRLDRAGEEILLSARDGRILDHIQFGEQVMDMSQGRWPDGAEPPFASFAEPTPGTANRLTAHPPIRILEAMITGEGFVLTWSGVSGARYEVQSQDRLGDSEWLPLSGEIVSVGSSVTWVDGEALVVPDRFYRVVTR
jgi:hypothetical protein